MTFDSIGPINLNQGSNLYTLTKFHANRTKDCRDTEI